jgi:WD40 repeat protein
VGIVGAVGGALDTAHARGLVHRDVKPANVLLADDGTVYLADFGLTRSIGDSGPADRPHLSGTPEYVAPEQIENGEVGPGSDIYSLGCVLFECLAAQPPFSASSPVGLLFAHLEKPPPSLHQQRPELPAAIDPVIATALAKQPADRYQSCQELCDAAGEALGLRWLAKAREWDERQRERSLLLRGNELKAAETYLDGVGAGANPALTALQREYVSASRSAISRRQRLIVAASLAVAAIAVVSLTFALISRNQATSEARRADASATQQLAQRLGAQALVEDELDTSLLLARQAVAIDDSPETRSDLLAAFLRNPAAIGIMRGCCQGFGAAALSTDGRFLAAASLSGATSLDLFDARSFERVGVDPSAQGLPEVGPYPWIRDLPENAQGLAFSPDGGTLAAVGVGLDDVSPYLLLLDARTGSLRAELRFEVSGAGDTLTRRSVGHLAYSSDGRLLATAQQEAQPDGSPGDWLLVLRDPDTGEPSGPALNTGAGRLEFAFAPDGRSVLTSNEGGGDALVQWDLETRAVRRRFAGEPGVVAVSPDGLTAAVGRRDGTVALVDLTSRRARLAAGGHVGAVSAVAFGPDGRTLVTGSEDGTTIVWDVASGRSREELRAHTAAIQWAAVSPDGKTLYTASQDGFAIAWDLSGDRRLGRTFTFSAPSAEHDLAFVPATGRFSPDGQLIAVGLEDEGIGLWDPRRLEPLAETLIPTGGRVGQLYFSADGTTLAAITLDGKATIWDLRTRSLLRGPWAANQGYGFGGLSPDGRTLAACGENGVTLWDVMTGAKVGQLGTAPPNECGFDRTGELFAIGRDSGSTVNPGKVEIWNVAQRKRISTLDADYWGAFTVGFSPVDDTLATAGWESKVRLWNARTGKPIRELDLAGSGYPGIWSLSFSPDGTVLAASGNKGSNVSLWDVAAGIQIGRLAGSLASQPGAFVQTTATFAPDGRHLLQIVGDGRGIVWDVDPASWAERACDIAGRTLTQQEWDEFLPGRPYEPACTSG